MDHRPPLGGAKTVTPSPCLMMRMLEIDQAVFASADRGAIRGYQLVARSAGIDPTCSQTLCRWSPTQLPLGIDQWALSYFGVAEDRVAISRTLWGGPEYSGRGSAEVVTVILLLRDDQFAAYAHDPLAVASTALALGWLRLPLDVSSGSLPRALLPLRPLLTPPLTSDMDVGAVAATADAALELIVQHRRVAVIGAVDPRGVIERLLTKLPQAARRQFSFTTGLAPTISRPFQVHFLRSADPTTLHNLNAQGVVCLKAGGATAPRSADTSVTMLANRAAPPLLSP